MVSHVLHQELSRNFKGIRDSATPYKVLFNIPPKSFMYFKETKFRIRETPTLLTDADLFGFPHAISKLYEEANCVNHRGMFGGHYISLYFEKYIKRKKKIESSLYPKQSSVKGQSFFHMVR